MFDRHLSENYPSADKPLPTVKVQALSETAPAQPTNLLDLFQQAPVFLAVLRGPEHVFQIINPLFQKLIGERDVIGKTVREAMPEAVTQGFVDLLDRVFQSGEPFAAQGMAVHIARTLGGPPVRRFLDFIYHPGRDVTGVITGIIIVGVDATESVRALESLRASEGRFRALAMASSDVIYRMNPDWSEMRQLQGRDFISDTSKPDRSWVEKYIHPEDRARVLTAVEEAIQAKAVFQLEHRVIRVDGTLGWTYSRAVPLLDEQAEITEWVGAATDITARKSIEHELRRSEEMFRSMADTLPQAVWVTDAQGQTQFFNKWWTDYCGIPFQSRTVDEVAAGVIHPEDGPKVLAAFREAQRTGLSFEVEQRNRTLAGEWRWFLNKGAPYRDPHSGEITRWFGASMDIHDRKHAEQELREQQDRFRFATAAAQIGYWFCNLPFSDLIWDERVKEHFWLAPDAPVTIDTFYERIHPEDREKTRQAIEASIEGKTDYETEYRTVSLETGKFKWIRAVGRTAYDGHGRPVRFDGITTDITLQKQSEEALRRSEKLAIVGRMASAISHEINNPLEAVTNLLYLIRTSPDTSPGQVNDYVSQAEQELARVSQIVTHSLQFNRQATGPNDESLSALLDSAVGIYKPRLMQAGIHFVRDYGESRTVLCMGSEVRQVFSNLVANAFDATRTGGTITLRTQDSTNWRTGQKGVRVLVADTGCGMDQQTLRRLFEPFFTTKQLNGTGLGLWVSADILKRHQATICVKSRQTLGRSGSVFSIFFPERGIAD